MSDSVTGPVRVRFAPSPTGFLHVGGARTAIYNELLRQKVGGEFLLRIEDTDRERSDDAMTQQIQDALSWIGIESDEGPYFQSRGVERHRERAEELLAGGKAYKAWETPDELNALREEIQKRDGGFYYREGCSSLSAEEIAERESSGAPFTVRFRTPQEDIRFRDLVRGDVEFKAEALDDFILLRSDGSPTYHMSVVCDDIDMKITHVIRGEDHLSNTPKHIPLFRALGGEVPTFAHLPLILGANKKRLSKRTGATSVEEFRSQGILPQTLYNFLALLGWSPGDDREIMSRAEMIEAFSVERLLGSAAVFDVEKLAWMNAQYMSTLPLDELMPHLESFLESEGLAEADRDRLGAALELHRTRARDLPALAHSVVPYFQDQLAYDPERTAKFRGQENLSTHLETLAERYAALDAFEIDPLDQALRAQCEELGEKAGYLIHPLRMALTAEKAGPPVFDLVAAMGREATAKHLSNFVEFLRS